MGKIPKKEPTKYQRYSVGQYKVKIMKYCKDKQYMNKTENI
jgi:hypothetical protein